MTKRYENKPGTYEIFIVETGEVLDYCRLRAATKRIIELKPIIKEKLDVRKVK